MEEAEVAGTETQDNAKTWYTSKTMWGAAIAIAAIIFAGAKGGGCAEAAGMVDSLTANADKVIGVVGGILAIYGRATAKGSISVKKPRKAKKAD